MSMSNVEFSRDDESVTLAVNDLVFDNPDLNIEKSGPTNVLNRVKMLSVVGLLGASLVLTACGENQSSLPAPTGPYEDRPAIGFGDTKYEHVTNGARVSTLFDLLDKSDGHPAVELQTTTINNSGVNECRLGFTDHASYGINLLDVPVVDGQSNMHYTNFNVTLKLNKKLHFSIYKQNASVPEQGIYVAECQKGDLSHVTSGVINDMTSVAIFQLTKVLSEGDISMTWHDARNGVFFV